jgi:AcrR family transcriptional regulator
MQYFVKETTRETGDFMARRPYRMMKRAEARDETRERILRATMALHDERGVATTSIPDVAERAGVGAATVYRNFPTVEALIEACGAHVWQDMRPPMPSEAAELFRGLATREERLERLVQELDAFYRRGELRLERAGQDRSRVPALDSFLNQVEAGIEAMVREALPRAPEAEIRVVLALTDFRVWLSLRRLKLSKPKLVSFILGLLACALRGTSESGPGATR